MSTRPVQLTLSGGASADGERRTMPTRHDNLFGQIANFQALRLAARTAIRGKRRKPGAAAFQFGLERELLRLERELLSGAWRPGAYIEIQLESPKRRLVSAAPFRDRVVHHAVMKIVGPLFERSFIDHSYANRIGKGTHRAIDVYERFRDRNSHVLRCDLYRFFPSIDHAILKGDLRRRIGCERTLWLLDTIIDGSNAQEPVYIHYPGDDLLAPLERRRGLPIGNLTSQWFANIHLDPLDHFCTEVLRAPYLRYVDDFALFARSADQLSEWQGRISAFLAKRRHLLHPRKTIVLPTREPAEFLGYVLHADGKRSLPHANVQRFKGRLKGMVRAHAAGSINRNAIDTRIDAWAAHASHAHTRALKRALLGRAATAMRRSTAGPRPDRPFARTV